MLLFWVHSFSFLFSIWNFEIVALAIEGFRAALFIVGIKAFGGSFVSVEKCLL